MLKLSACDWSSSFYICRLDLACSDSAKEARWGLLYLQIQDYFRAPRNICDTTAGAVKSGEKK